MNWSHENTLVGRLPNQALSFKYWVFIADKFLRLCVFLVDISTELPTYIHERARWCLAKTLRRWSSVNVVLETATSPRRSTDCISTVTSVTQSSIAIDKLNEHPLLLLVNCFFYLRKNLGDEFRFLN